MEASQKWWVEVEGVSRQRGLALFLDKHKHIQGEDQSNAGNDHPHHTDTRRDRIYQ